jgi:hypothetical protein
MQIYDLDYSGPIQTEVIGGLAPRAIATSGASAKASGYLSITKTRSITQATVAPGQAASAGRATALSIVTPTSQPNSSGILASGRSTVSSLGQAQV